MLRAPSVAQKMIHRCGCVLLRRSVPVRILPLQPSLRLLLFARLTTSRGGEENGVGESNGRGENAGSGAGASGVGEKKNLIARVKALFAGVYPTQPLQLVPPPPPTSPRTNDYHRRHRR